VPGIGQNIDSKELELTMEYRWIAMRGNTEMRPA
jgi:hypothetical protein